MFSSRYLRLIAENFSRAEPSLNNVLVSLSRPHHDFAQSTLLKVTLNELQRPNYLPMRKNDFSLPAFMRTEGMDDKFGNAALFALKHRTAVNSMFGKD